LRNTPLSPPIHQLFIEVYGKFPMKFHRVT
jgi:hypothetical protein